MVMDEKTAAIHHFLNDLHEKAELIKAQLKAKGVPARLLYERERYLLVDGVYRNQKYPIPALRIDPSTEIGVNLDGIFFDFWCEKEQVDAQRVLSELTSQFSRVEAYCPSDQKDFYTPGKDLDEAAEAICQCSDPLIGFAIFLEHSVPGIVEKFLKARAIIAAQTVSEPEPALRASC